MDFDLMDVGCKSHLILDFDFRPHGKQRRHQAHRCQRMTLCLIWGSVIGLGMRNFSKSIKGTSISVLQNCCLITTGTRNGINAGKRETIPKVYFIVPMYS